MRIGYFDCFSGVSGDMWVGALLDAGLPLPALEEAVAALSLPGVTVRAERVLRAGLAGTRFCVAVDGVEQGRALDEQPQGPHPMPLRAPLLVRAAPHGHRRLADILQLVRRAGLPARAAADCTAVFEAIAAVEAKAHGIGVEDVHFHEVGAVDTIVDVVCACLGVRLLGLERLYASAVAVGSGTVRAAHGVLPVPAPATLDLLAGIPVRQGGLAGERTTPTGAALLRTLVSGFEPQFTWVPGGRGYGAGFRDDPQVPNLLRLSIGELREPGSAQQMVELQCTLDTATGELLSYLIDELLRRGAADAFVTPVHMKKGRPGQLLTVLAELARADALTAFLLEDGGTLGVRSHRVERAVLERWAEVCDSPLGAVRCKAARLPSGVVVRRPEDDELRRLGRELGLSRREVLQRLGDLQAGPMDPGP